MGAGIDRRELVRRLAGLGLTAPMVSQLLLSSGPAVAAPAAPYKPAKAGGGGTLRLLSWQAPTSLNPHFASGNKDREAARIFYEPLAGWDLDGNLVPQLAASLPNRADGTVSADAREVIWTLKKGVTWHDGKPFTAADVVFTAAYASDPDSATSTIGSYQRAAFSKIDDHTIRIVFEEATPFWADAFVGVSGMILPEHLFSGFKGKNSREAPANLAPVGTGPYKFAEFKPGDIVTGVRNPDYHVANQPYFDAFELKGGGDSVSAARTVLQTGQFDFARDLQVEDEVLKRLETGRKGRVEFYPSGQTEIVVLNTTDPVLEIDGERSHPRSQHPTLSDPEVRKAINLLIDRDSIQKFIHGRAGSATGAFVNQPERFRSPKLTYEFSIDKANAILDAAGYARDTDGIRQKGGKRLKYVFQTTITGPRQKAQAVIKAACQKAGIELELKSVTASVYFSSDIANPDTLKKFYCDIEMHASTGTQPDPQAFLRQFTSWEIAAKDNKWQGRNFSRFRSDEADELYRSAEKEVDPLARLAQLLRLSEIFVEANVYLPILARNVSVAITNDLVTVPSGWDSDFWNIAAWYKG
ncbi:peptide ABC transporter substrate-binding protein [uncultured Bosea sp.]|uniref:peptide ABC transporter substrate-binding protein n=1 Tax=uncultured Bosea sp. TaxID=211457 RepID=UPI0025D0D59C|nr:peptide ABC transporter substrate-binding protein [uncultured Bosea sp.]